jgi:hypothetical protein
MKMSDDSGDLKTKTPARAGVFDLVQCGTRLVAFIQK